VDAARIGSRTTILAETENAGDKEKGTGTNRGGAAHRRRTRPDDGRTFGDVTAQRRRLDLDAATAMADLGKTNYRKRRRGIAEEMLMHTMEGSEIPDVTEINAGMDDIL